MGCRSSLSRTNMTLGCLKCMGQVLHPHMSNTMGVPGLLGTLLAAGQKGVQDARGDPCQLRCPPTNKFYPHFLRTLGRVISFFGRSKIQQGNVRGPGSVKPWQFSSAQKGSPALWLPGQPPVWSAHGGGSPRGSESIRKLQQVVASAWLWCHPAQHGSEDTRDSPLGRSAGPPSRWCVAWKLGKDLVFIKQLLRVLKRDQECLHTSWMDSKALHALLCQLAHLHEVFLKIPTKPGSQRTGRVEVPSPSFRDDRGLLAGPCKGLQARLRGSQMWAGRSSVPSSIPWESRHLDEEEWSHTTPYLALLNLPEFPVSTPASFWTLL